MNRENNIAVLGAFVMEGIDDALYARSLSYGDLSVSDQLGWYEFVYEATSHAGFMQHCYEAGLAANDDNSPGVYPYEVTNEFGRFFANYSWQVGDTPTRIECQQWIEQHTKKFFNQGRLPL